MHHITVNDQPGCEVHEVWVDGVPTGQHGPQTVGVGVKNTSKALTVSIDVDCHTIG